MIIGAAVILTAVLLVNVGIVTHIFLYFHEVDTEFGDCLDSIDDPFEWGHSYGLIRNSFIIQWFALVSSVVCVVSSILYSRNDAIIY